MTNEQKEQILAYKRDGFGYKKIGQLMGLSENTIKSFCKRNKSEEKQIDAQDGICPCCGKPIQVSTGRKQKKFCSDKCRMKWWNEHLDRVDKRQITNSFVPAAKSRSRLTGMPIGSIAATNATSRTDSEVVAMSKEEMEREKLYQATMAMARSMLRQCLITEDEYRQIDTIFTEKYAPSSGTLFADIDLINAEKYGNI